MKDYQKIMRRLISHPGCAIGIIRNMAKRYRKCCPRCGIVTCSEIHHTDERGVRTHRCQYCRQTFTELYGTIFYKSKIPLSSWLLAVIYWINSTGGLSAAELGRDLSISHMSAWKMLMRIREAMKNGLSDDLLQGTTEGDEAWFGKKKSKPGKGKKPKHKTDNQEIFLGIVERGRKRLRLIAIPDVKEETLYPHIRDNVRKGSKFFTDSRVSYAITGIEYHHQVTNHSAKEFARGEVHSNTIERIWGDIKGIIRTIHHGVTKKYRELYFAQYIFRYENKDSTNLFFKTLCQLFSPTYCII
jgi:transposase-like protein